MSLLTDVSLSQRSQQFLPQSNLHLSPDNTDIPLSWDVLTAFERIAAHSVTLLDTRSQQSFKHLRIPDARNIPFEVIATSAGDSLMEDLHRTSPICVYSTAGASSRMAATKLLRSGYSNVFYIDHGFLGWHKKGLPCVTEIQGELVQIVTDRVGLAAPVFLFD